MFQAKPPLHPIHQSTGTHSLARKLPHSPGPAFARAHAVLPPRSRRCSHLGSQSPWVGCRRGWSNRGGPPPPTPTPPSPWVPPPPAPAPRASWAPPSATPPAQPPSWAPGPAPARPRPWAGQEDVSSLPPPCPRRRRQEAFAEVVARSLPTGRPGSQQRAGPRAGVARAVAPGASSRSCLSDGYGVKAGGGAKAAPGPRSSHRPGPRAAGRARARTPRPPRVLPGHVTTHSRVPAFGAAVGPSSGPPSAAAQREPT